MTRDSDVFVPLGTRCAIANSYRNAIFVSVHFNSATRRGASGIETYFYSRDSLSPRVGDSSLRCRWCAVREAAACVAVVTSSCEGRICRPCSSSAVFSLTRPKLRTLRMLLIVKNLPKRLQPESADAIPSRSSFSTTRVATAESYSAATVHRPNQGHQIQKEPVEAFGQEKQSTKEEDFIETGRDRSTRGVIGSGGLIGPANFDFGADASRGTGCIC